MVSIIIPTLNEEAQLDDCLARTLHLCGPKELIVSDGGSTDGTRKIAEQYPEVLFLQSPRGRARQLNAGAARTRGEILLFLHADTRLPEQALSYIREYLHHPEVAGGSFALQFDHPHPLLRFQAWCSRLNSTFTTFGDQAIFVRARIFRELGGFPDQPLMEDWELQHRMRQSGRFVKVREPVTTASRRFLGRGVWRQTLLNVYLFARYQLGADAHQLARQYHAQRTR